MKPKIDNPRNEYIRFRCTSEEKQAVEELAKYLEMSTGTLARNLLLTSFEDAIIFKKLGILKGAKQYNEFKKKYHTFFSPVLPGME